MEEKKAEEKSTNLRASRAGRGHRLSIVGGGTKRRQSILAVSIQDQIRQAEDKLPILLAAMTKECEKGEFGEAEFCAWALSAMSEMSSGNAENRKRFMQGNGRDVVLKFMSYHINDVYVQWQGMMAIGTLCAEDEYVEAFGGDGVQAVLDCLGRSDVSELGATGCRALKALVVGNDKNMAEAREQGAAEILDEMIKNFPNEPTFQYRAQLLLKQISDKE